MPITYHPTLPADLNDTIMQGFQANALEARDITTSIDTFAFILEESGEALGAVSGFSYYGCLHISILFIMKPYRNQGHGKALLGKAEALAHERDCRLITINSMEWEAHSYYEKLGYAIDHIQNGYTNGTAKYFLKKELTA